MWGVAILTISFMLIGYFMFLVSHYDGSGDIKKELRDLKKEFEDLRDEIRELHK